MIHENQNRIIVKIKDAKGGSKAVFASFFVS